MANTSTATISRVLSGKPGVSAAKRASILRLAERDGMPVDRLAEMFGLSRRTIFRVLRSGKQQAARGRP
ncbi:MAG: helix-turn-helix domain-containing protein [Dehalococcoidia bacterium]|nr:helix-turn-helix domain-containing protein [Dehalococcoidia bacterium]